MWHDESNYLALLAVDNEIDLCNILFKAERKGIKATYFREPDLDNAITAIAIGPGPDSKKLCSNIKLMGK